MKKKKLVWFIVAVVVAVLAIVAVLAVRRLSNLHLDITGVTTLDKTNMVIMNSPEAGAFVSGEGQFTVGSDQTIHLEYTLEAGSIDIAFQEGAVSLDVFKNADLGNLTADPAAKGGIFGASGLSGKGSLDFTAPQGTYTVFFNMHDTVGAAVVGAKK